jgi:hypothetical protein
MSLALIHELSREAAVKAARLKKQPLVVEKEDLESGNVGAVLRGIPFLGDYKPANWVRVPRAKLFPSRKVSPYRLAGLTCGEDYVFVDSSGFGQVGEGALTYDEFVDLVSVNPHCGWGIVEAGQFQVIIAAFKRRAKSK